MEDDFMDAHTRKVYVPMTETGFYILFCLQKPNHGYGIVQMTEKLTDGEIRLAPGTMYGSLSKMEKDGLIRFVTEEDKRKKLKVIKNFTRMKADYEKNATPEKFSTLLYNATISFDINKMLNRGKLYQIYSDGLYLDITREE